MDHEYLLDKVDVWIENQIKGDYNAKGYNRYWVRKMGKKLEIRAISYNILT